jgi:LytS/YehU family sensor histidine kinase
MPPMILLPLLDQALNEGSSTSGVRSTIGITAHITPSKLRVEIAVSGGAFTAHGCDAVLGDIQTRLRAIYKGGGNLAFGPTSDGSRAVIEIPYEPTDSRHR